MAASLLLLSACGGNESSGTDDAVVVIPSVNGTVLALAGGGRHVVNLSFNASDGEPLSGLSITAGLSTLPAGWTGPASFNCATIGTGTGCVLTLIYAPAISGSGILTMQYHYVDNAGVPKTGSISIPYTSSASDNVVATASVAGQVNAVVNAGAQAVAVTFTTDDGTVATALTLTTDLASLPAGWTSTAHNFACSTLSTGSGCELPLSFQPTVAGSGTLLLDYDYTDDAGLPRTGSMQIAYASTTNDDVVATVTPGGQITAVAGGGAQAVTVNFTTNDGNTASDLSLTGGLTSLPAGWTSTAQTFSCSAVSSGNGCQLPLTYAPSIDSNGTLSLAFTYTNDAGVAKTGGVAIAYAATVHDNVIGTVLPSGQVSAVVGASRNVTVTFTTDDGHPATAVALTTALNALPAGWTSADTTFSCGTVSTGSGCQLPLTYAPTTVGGGVLTLSYGYADDAGTAKTATLSIPYVATSHDNAVATVAPTAPLSAVVNATENVTVTFTTDDTNVATALSVTSGLSSLPAGWSAPAAFTCASFSTGAACQLGLTFAPTTAGSGTLQLSYAYTDNAGAGKTGTVNIAYSAIARHIYIVDESLGVFICSINANGTPSGCTTTGGLTGTTSIAFAGHYAYVANFQASAMSVCAVAVDGTLSACGNSGSNFTNPAQSAVVGAMLYTANANAAGVTACQINAVDGTLSNCALTAAGISSNFDAAAVGNGYAYVGAGSIYACVVAAPGVIDSCAATATGVNFAAAVALSTDGYAYIADQGYGLASCAVNLDGSLSNCGETSIGGDAVRAVALNGSHGYVAGSSFNPNTGMITEDFFVCTVGAGAVSSCTVSDGGATFNNLWGITVH